ncbi:uridine nucleosidase [Tricholoma matsutake]|nr:uridine nucleosidase [Tricholoma matsutake 945]
MKHVWLDVDPVWLCNIYKMVQGHDDATAIMLAIHCTNIHLLGVSTTHGNASSELTAVNAARCLLAFGAQPHVRVYPGASKPLLVAAKSDPEIHGDDGLGGVEGLPPADSPEVLALFATSEDGSTVRALEGMAKSVKETWSKGAGQKVTVVSSGPMTNIALFISVYPDLLDAVDEFVFMGGGVGIGNRSAVAEYNILCDPHATQIVLDTPVKKTMIPINVTHTAIVTKHIQALLLNSGAAQPSDDILPPPASNLRHTLSTLITFFGDSYKSTFGFNDGPPLHDALTVGYVSNPELFKTTRYRVDVELNGKHCMGETVVDIWQYRDCDDSWGSNGRNCLVAQSLDVPAFFNILLECVSRCDAVSPLNSSG